MLVDTNIIEINPTWIQFAKSNVILNKYNMWKKKSKIKNVKNIYNDGLQNN
jgi:hypothetical protein